MKAEYINHMGSDLTIANAARVSFDKESSWVQQGYIPGDDLVLDGIERPASHEPYEDWHLICDENGVELTGFMLSKRDEKLIKSLARDGHYTPFTHCVVTMRETMPIFLARQRFKHTVGFSYNEVSRRYVNTPPEFYYPDVWRKASKDKKQGSSDEEITHIDVHHETILAGTDEQGPYYDRVYRNVPVKQEYINFIQSASDLYDEMIKGGVCPEMARMILPQSMCTSYYVTGSLMAWARMYNLRQADGAQKEWGEILPQISDVMNRHFPIGWSALVGDK